MRHQQFQQDVLDFQNLIHLKGLKYRDILHVKRLVDAKKSWASLFFPFLILLLYIPGKAQEQESIFDRKVDLQEGLQEVPMVPRWERELGIKGNHVLAGDVNLWVEEIGEGTPLVLVAGGPGTSHHYFHPHFQAAAAFSKVIFYDLRGVGLSDYNPGEGYSVLQAVEDLENLRKAMGIDAWAILGLSFGGAIVQYYAMKYPERVKGIIHVASFIPTRLDLGIGTRQRDFQSKEEVEHIGKIYSIAGQRVAPAHTDQVNPDLQAKMVYNAFMSGDWKRRHLYRLSKKEIIRYARYEWRHDKNYYPEMLQDGLSLDFTDLFQDCPIPTLIFEGKWDLAFGEDKPKTMMQLLPNAKMVYYENAGHITFEDVPEAFFLELENFIKNLPSVSREKVRKWKESISGKPLRKK